jgi:molybdenum cofactor cytidylyltransferase
MPAAQALDGWGALVLAAGAGRRFGGAKMLASLDGAPVIRRTVDAVLAAGFAEVVVATGAQHEAVAAALEGLSCRIVPVAGWKEGMAASLRTGIAAMVGGQKGLFVFLGDMPMVPTDLCAPLAAMAATSGYAARPVLAGKPCHPVCFTAAALPDLRALQGDQGAAQVLGRKTEGVAYLETDAIGAVLDIDSPGDLACAERAWKSRATSATSDSAMSRGVLPKP